MLLREEAVAVNSKKEELKQAVSRTKELEVMLSINLEKLYSNNCMWATLKKKKKEIKTSL